jgi:hypothetical protein
LNPILLNLQSFYLLNYSKALIDINSLYLKDFDHDFSKLSKLGINSFQLYDSNYINSNLIPNSVDFIFHKCMELFLKSLDKKLCENAIIDFLKSNQIEIKLFKDVVDTLRSDKVKFYYVKDDIGVLGFCTCN